MSLTLVASAVIPLVTAKAKTPEITGGWYLQTDIPKGKKWGTVMKSVHLGLRELEKERLGFGRLLPEISDPCYLNGFQRAFSQVAGIPKKTCDWSRTQDVRVYWTWGHTDILPRRLCVPDVDDSWWENREYENEKIFLSFRNVLLKVGAGSVVSLYRHHHALVKKDPVTKKPYVSYIKSNLHGVLGRRTRASVGGYLREYYVPGTEEVKRLKIEGLTEPRIVKLSTKIAEFMKEASPELKLARTPEEISRVYREGPDGSCMSPKSSYYRGKAFPLHPASVYGAGDLAVAYLEKEGRITARGVVWPEKKLWCSTYGDMKVLARVLEEEGYERGQHTKFCPEPKQPDFSGARLLSVRAFEECESSRLMPYVDFRPTYGVLHKDEYTGEEYWVVGYRNRGQIQYPFQWTHGWFRLDGKATIQCGKCHSFVEREGDLRVVAWWGIPICRTCEESHFQCGCCSKIFHVDETEGFEVEGMAGKVCETCVRENTRNCKECGVEVLSWNLKNFRGEMTKNRLGICRACHQKLTRADRKLVRERDERRRREEEEAMRRRESESPPRESGSRPLTYEILEEHREEEADELLGVVVQEGEEEGAGGLSNARFEPDAFAEQLRRHREQNPELELWERVGTYNFRYRSFETLLPHPDQGPEDDGEQGDRSSE